MDAKTLRASILQMAIEGKLVPQLDEEPAVEQIGNAPEEVPFEIPGKWQWGQLDSLFTFIDYRGKTPTKTSSGIRLMTASNVRSGYIDHTRVEYISVEEFEQRKSRGISHKGDILFTTEAPLGLAALADLDTYSAGQRVITLQGHSQIVNALYVFFLLSPSFQKELKNQATGTTAQGIKAARLKKMWLPIPPIAEQRRIVARLNELLPLVDKFGKAQEALAAAQKEFPEKLKASLLQEAIQGKLVPQLDEEPAVEQIGEAPEDVPFAIPEKWQWVEFSSIATLLNGRAYKKNELLTKAEGNTPIIRVGNFFTNSSWFYSNLKLDENKYCDNGDLLFSWSASFGPKIWQGGKAIYHYHIWKIILSKFVDKEWIYYWLLGKTEELKASGHGLAMIHITKSGMEKELVALPPFEEQRRIVARLNELLPLVTQMATATAK